jgi:hypothetical protein
VYALIESHSQPPKIAARHNTLRTTSSQIALFDRSASTIVQITLQVMPDDHSKLVPPLPIPNRTVKRLSADDSAATSVKVGHHQACSTASAPTHSEPGRFALYSPNSTHRAPPAPSLHSTFQTPSYHPHYPTTHNPTHYHAIATTNTSLIKILFYKECYRAKSCIQGAPA